MEIQMTLVDAQTSNSGLFTIDLPCVPRVGEYIVAYNEHRGKIDVVVKSVTWSVSPSGHAVFLIVCPQ